MLNTYCMKFHAKNSKQGKTRLVCYMENENLLHDPRYVKVYKIIMMSSQSVSHEVFPL